MARWCSAVQSISLEALEAASGDLKQAPANARAHLEHGFDELLKACSNTLKVLTIIGCDNVLTDRQVSWQKVIWLASACPFLEVVTYITASHVTLPEALWSLGAGCRRVKTLIVPPLNPLKKQGYAGHRVCQMLGKCWPELQVLCIGGRNLTLASLCCILRSCVNLSSFEIDRGRDIDEGSAVVLAEAGLQRIQQLYLTHTVISPGAVMILHGGCPRLKEISVVLHRRDFNSSSAFSNFVAGLRALQQTAPFDSFVRLGFTDERESLAEEQK
ncbi:F-box only protein 41-like [Dermacentor variabilis]|uniref:F-box only protein 41-like n=1 Tax=Dermacentor variabilis TaxID=34621 RepID=UPI003F5B214B